MEPSSQITITIQEFNISSPDASVLSNLASYETTDSALIEFYRKEICVEQLITPFQLSCLEGKMTGVYHKYGEKCLNFSVSTFSKDDILCLLGFALDLAKHLLGNIKIENIFYDKSHGFKVLLHNTFATEDQYLMNLKAILLRLFPKLELEFGTMAQLLRIHSQMSRGKQKIVPFSKLHQLRGLLPKGKPTKIVISPEDLTWIKQTIGFKNGKYELVYDGIEHNFDPVPLHKILNKKCRLVYFLQEGETGKLLAFYPNFTHEVPLNLPFGRYFADPALKSVLIELPSKEVHKLSESQFAVGYGPQLLLAVGNIDIILSAYNIANSCNFPCSYGCTQPKPSPFFSHFFKLKQLQVYAIN